MGNDSTAGTGRRARGQAARCAARLAAGAALLGLGTAAFAQPQETAAPPVSGTVIAFRAAGQTPYFVLVRGKDGSLVRCLASAAGPPGERSIVWDGKDAFGREAAPGTYRTFLSAGVAWELDRGFGKAGRIGRTVTEQLVRDPQAPIPVPGVLDRMAFSGIINAATADIWPNPYWPMPVWVDRVTVNGRPWGRVDEFTGTNASFVFRRGAVTVNPVVLHPGDTVHIVSYDTCFLENPWDVAVADDGSPYVLLRWQGVPGGYGGSLVKLTPDGRKVDAAFGVDGEIPFIFRSHQATLAPRENRLYIAGSHWGMWGTGAFRMDTGAFWFYLGGSGNESWCTYLPSGVSLGRNDKIYIGDLKVYDRTRPLHEGFLYSATVKTGIVRPGPSMAPAAEPDTFYLTGWSTGISKMKDTGGDVTELYSLALPHKIIGVCLDASRSLVYAGSRDPGGFVSVLADDAKAFREVARLEDPALGGVHTVRYHDGLLYVVEDGAAFTADGYVAVEVARELAAPAGKNRISRYRLTFGREHKLAKIDKP